MKWTKPTFGDERTKTAFLIFPKTIRRETRWLERASWLEIYKKVSFCDEDGLYLYTGGKWLECYWIDT